MLLRQTLLKYRYGKIANMNEKLLEQLISYMVNLAGIVGVIFMYWVIKKLKSISDKLDKPLHKPMSGEQLEVALKTHSLLSELRSKLRADRAYIFEIHNGDDFPSVAPNHKLTCTYEVANEGISEFADKLQNVKASYIYDFTTAVFMPSAVLPKGMHRIKDMIRCRDEECSNIGGLLMHTNEMPEGYTKNLWRQKGIRDILVAPIFSVDKVNPIGVLALDYCHEDTLVLGIDMLTKHECMLCNYAGEISSLWHLHKKERFEPKVSIFKRILDKL